MALDYFLTIYPPGLRLEPAQVGRAMTAALGLRQNPSSGVLEGEGFSASVFPPERERSGTSEHPGVCVAFRIGKGHDQAPGIVGMLQVVSALLRLCRGEACLSFEFETTLLVATDGHVSFTEEDPGFWTASRQALLADCGSTAESEHFAG